MSKNRMFFNVKYTSTSHTLLTQPVALMAVGYSINIFIKTLNINI